MPNQHSMDEARAFNAALDRSLRSNGTVDRELYLRLRDAYTFQAASSVGWVEAKLRVLLGRVDQGMSLSLFSPMSNDQAVVENKSAFEQWAETNFPGTLK